MTFLKYFIIFLFSSFVAQTAFCTPQHSNEPKTTTIQILGMNDFHGQIVTGRKLNNHPVGGAAVLASYLKNAQHEYSDSTLFALIGDQLSASPPASALLLDEPTILFFNSLANQFCSQNDKMNPKCNIVATVGNHEFDRSLKTMLEIINGRDTPPTEHWIDLPTYPGASFPFVSANIVDEKTEKPLFTPYVIKKIKGIPIAFIGAILKNAPDVILPCNIKGIKFLDEAESINKYIPEIKAQGVNVFIVIIHQGGKQDPYDGPTRDDTKIEGPIVDVVKKLDDAIDVVMSAHTHQFTNGFLTNSHGKKILVTQANSYSASFADVLLEIDNKSNSVIKESAKIINTYADQFPGTVPDPETQQLVKLAEIKTDPIIQSEVGILKEDLLRKSNEAGESNLGNLVADAARYAVNAEIGFYQPGGIRADLFAGKITWGNVYAVAPFLNPIVKMKMTGQDVYDLLEQQWTFPTPIILQVSGISYLYDLSKPVGQRIVSITYHNNPLDRAANYTVGTVQFLALGGDGFSIMKKAQFLESSVLENDSLLNYIKTLPQPFSASIEGRIQRKS